MKRMKSPAYAAKHRKRMREYEQRRRADPIRGAKLRARDVANYAKDCRGPMLCAARLRAKRDGVRFAIVKADIVVPEFCPALGIRLSVTKGKPGDGSPTIDRFIPARGYVPGNVAVISHRANRIKNNASLFELQAVAVWLKSVTTNGDLSK